MKPPSFPEVSYAEWLERVKGQLDKGDLEGVSLEPLYTCEHPTPWQELVIPTGISTSELDDLSWIPCQSFASADLEKLNHHLKSDLRNGVSGVWLRFDEASRRGEDPMISSRVGKHGVSVYRLQDLEAAFRDTPSDWRVLLLDGGESFMASGAIVAHWLANQGTVSGNQTVLFGADPLGALAREGALCGSFDAAANDLAELTRFSRSQSRDSRALCVNAGPYREAGATADQEIAVCLSTGVEYLRSLGARGVAPDAVAAETAFVTSTGQQIFLEIAKLRALRILWSHVLSECDLALPTAAWIHASILRRSLQSREPATNLMRITTASWAGVLGGADSLETPGYDCFELGGNFDRSRRLARNIQSILGLESQLGRVADPSSGSYLLDRLTRELIERSWILFQEIESRGGLLESLLSGWLQESIENQWAERRGQIERGEVEITGLNAYADPDTRSFVRDLGSTPELLETIRYRYASQRIDSLGRGGEEPGTNRWEWCLQAAAANRSIAEMIGHLSAKTGGLEVSPLRPHRDSEPYEEESLDR